MSVSNEFQSSKLNVLGTKVWLHVRNAIPFYILDNIGNIVNVIDDVDDDDNIHNVDDVDNYDNINDVYNDLLLVGFSLPQY